MALDNYSDLQAAIAGWLTRTDLTAFITDYISLTEAEADREVRDVAMIVRATATLSNEYEQLPTDYLEMSAFELYGSPPTWVDYITPQHFNQKRESLWAPGRPQNFTIIGEEMRFLPPPDGSYTGEMQYFGQITRLSNSNPTNWLLTKHPAVYLWGSLLKAAPHMRDDDRVETWSALYSTELQSIKDAYRRATHNAGPLRMRSGIGIAATSRP
jgi:hypothetical protein